MQLVAGTCCRRSHRLNFDSGGSCFRSYQARQFHRRYALQPCMPRHRRAPDCWRSAEAEAVMQRACMLISSIEIPRIPMGRPTSSAIGAIKQRPLLLSPRVGFSTSVNSGSSSAEASLLVVADWGGQGDESDESQASLGSSRWWVGASRPVGLPDACTQCATLQV